MSYGNRMGTRVDASPMASKSNFLAGRVNSVINQKTARHPPATILSMEEVRPPGVRSWGKRRPCRRENVEADCNVPGCK